MPQQNFLQTNNQPWLALEQFPGAELLPLAEPISQGSIHRLRMEAGTIIPVHTHPSNEYVYVLKGVVETGGISCAEGMFWFTPAHTQQGPHIAVTDVEILTIRLGPMGTFES